MMISALGQHLNKNVLVSIPTIFKDSRPRACVLMGIETSGLWLESRDLAERLLNHHDGKPVPPIFVPFTQVAFLLEPEVVVPPDSSPNRHAKVSANERSRAKAKTRQKKSRPT
jgi:hypothetical protein